MGGRWAEVMERAETVGRMTSSGRHLGCMRQWQGRMQTKQGVEHQKKGRMHVWMSGGRA